MSEVSIMSWRHGSGLLWVEQTFDDIVCPRKLAKMTHIQPCSAMASICTFFVSFFVSDDALQGGLTKSELSQGLQADLFALSEAEKESFAVVRAILQHTLASLVFLLEVFWSFDSTIWARKVEVKKETLAPEVGVRDSSAEGFACALDIVEVMVALNVAGYLLVHLEFSH